MDEYLCLTLLSKPGEDVNAFKARLSAFWTWMLRERPDEFEKVYAEMVGFETQQDQLSRKYLIEMEVAKVLDLELKNAGLDFQPIDSDDLYSKYEAAPPDWFWIEH